MLNNWDIERAISHAVPIPHKTILSGWYLHRCGGPIRRINSFNPSENYSCDLEPLIDFAKNQNISPIIFRIPDMAKNVDPILANKNFSISANTHTLFAKNLSAIPSSKQMDIMPSKNPSNDWLMLRKQIIEHSLQDHQIYVQCLNNITHPAQFLTCYTLKTNKPAAICYGVIVNNILVIEAVATVPEYRRNGCARAMVSSLMKWGYENGSTGSVLQVEASNEGAIKLYKDMGFEDNLYDYHYRTLS